MVRVIDGRTRAMTDAETTNADAFLLFDSITNPAVWQRFQTVEEMETACQIPENVLKNMSTDNLIQVCMKYPLYGNYLDYNNELDGIKFIMNGFNGFTEFYDLCLSSGEKLASYWFEPVVEL